MRVFAYLDPGTGSMVLQMILGGTAAVLVSIKMFGKRVFRTLMFWKRDDHEAEQAEHNRPAATTSSAPRHETEKEPV